MWSKNFFLFFSQFRPRAFFLTFIERQIKISGTKNKFRKVQHHIVMGRCLSLHEVLSDLKKVLDKGRFPELSVRAVTPGARPDESSKSSRVNRHTGVIKRYKDVPRYDPDYLATNCPAQAKQESHQLTIVKCIHYYLPPHLWRASSRTRARRSSSTKVAANIFSVSSSMVLVLHPLPSTMQGSTRRMLWLMLSVSVETREQRHPRPELLGT